MIGSSLITIIIPTYRRYDFFVFAFDSAINQITNTKYQILVVDDEACEYINETEKYIRNVSSKIKVTYLKNKKNLGLFGNWNKAINLVDTDWAVLLMDDDYISSNYIDICAKLISSGFSDLFTFKNSYFSTNDEVSNNKKYDVEHIKLQKIFSRDFIKGNVLGAPAGMLFKKELFENIKGFNEELYPSSDWDFYYRASKITNVSHVISPIISYWRNVNNTSSDERTRKLFILKDIQILRKVSSDLNLYLRFVCWLYQYKYIYKNCKHLEKVEIRKLGFYFIYKPVYRIIARIIRFYEYIDKKGRIVSLENICH